MEVRGKRSPSRGSAPGSEAENQPGKQRAARGETALRASRAKPVCSFACRQSAVRRQGRVWNGKHPGIGAGVEIPLVCQHRGELHHIPDRHRVAARRNLQVVNPERQRRLKAACGRILPKDGRVRPVSIWCLPMEWNPALRGSPGARFSLSSTATPTAESRTGWRGPAGL